RLTVEAEEEAEVLDIVAVSMVHRHRQVEGERSRAERWDVDANAEARRDAEVLAMELNIALNGAEVAEHHTFDHVVGRQREHIFRRANKTEPTTNIDARFGRRRTTKVKTAERRVTTGEIVLENGRFFARDTHLAAQAQG